MQTEFEVAQEEIARRKRAFTTLSLSIFLSVILCSIDFVVAVPRVALPCVVALGAILLLLRHAVHKSTNKFGKRSIVLTDEAVMNVSGGTDSEIRLAEICFMRVKTKVRGSTREILLKTAGGTRFGISGIRDFERLESELTNRLGKAVEVRKLVEPIDFDHPWFYVFFGIVVGCTTTGLIRLAPLMSYGTVRTLNIVTSALVLSVGVFWIFTKPGVATYGRKVLAADRAFGTLLIAIGLLLGAYAVFFL